MSVTNLEAVAANAVRRAAIACEPLAVARVDDLDAMVASSSGKLEIESLDDRGQGPVFTHLVNGAVLTVFKEWVAPDLTRAVVDAFEEGAVAETGEAVSSADLAGLVDSVPSLRVPVTALVGGDDSVASRAAAVAFVLEGLHLSKRLNKDTTSGRTRYLARG